MKKLKYTIIKTKKQYNEYCKILETLLSSKGKNNQDEIELLTLLIEKWDNDHNPFNELEPVELLKELMKIHNIRPKNLSEILGLSKGTVSKILNYQKGLSKETIRKLSLHFKMTQEAFNRPYKLVNDSDKDLRKSNLKRTKKRLKTIPA